MENITAHMLQEYKKREDGIIANAVEIYLKRPLVMEDVGHIRKVYKYNTNTRYALYYKDVELGDMKLKKTRITFKAK